MASWSFRRRIKIIPGVRLNFSRSGISTSIGLRGANLTLGKNGTYLNTGIPGTGIYKRQKISSPSNKNTNDKQNVFADNQPVQEKVDNIFSIEPTKITSQDMEGVKQSIIDAHSQRLELQKDINKVKKELLFSKIKFILVYLFIVGFVAKNTAKDIKLNILKQKQAILDLQKQKDESYVDLGVEFDKDSLDVYEGLIENFTELIRVEKVWDITREEENDRVKTRSSASRAINRKEVKFCFSDLEDIKYSKQALCFTNANGADLYFYPSFIIVQSKDGFGVIGLNEIEFYFAGTSFVEQEKVSKDAEIIDYTWLKVNKNGSPDKRFKGNYQIPIVKYGTITLKTKSGINEEYHFSNYLVSEKFANSFLDFKKIIKS